MDIIQQNRRLIGQSQAEFLSNAAASYPQPEPLTDAQEQFEKLKFQNHAVAAANFKLPDASWAHPDIKPRQTKVRVQVQGSVVRVKARRTTAERGATFERGWNGGESMAAEAKRTDIAASSTSGNKSQITEFSPASRRNLMDKMCTLLADLWLRSWFLTLTYHNDYPDPKAAKQHLRAFYKRICYYAKRSKLGYKPAIIWRVEPQKRGAPHFHLFVFNSPKIPKYMLLQWWQEITGDDTITQIDREHLTTRRKAMNYLAKYISKDKFEIPSSSDAGALLDIALYWAKAGRYWGTEGITDDMFAEVNQLVVDVTNTGLLRFLETMEMAFPFLVDRWSLGFRVFTYDQPADSIWALAAALLTHPPHEPPVLQTAVAIEPDKWGVWLSPSNQWITQTHLEF